MSSVLDIANKLNETKIVKVTETVIGHDGEVAEFDVFVKVRSYKAQMEIGTIAQNGGDVIPRVIANDICAENGDPLFTAEAVEELPSELVRALMNATNRVNSVKKQN